MLKINEKIWEQVSAVGDEDFERDIERYEKYEQILSELHSCGLLDEEWEDIEEKLVYSFIMRCFVEIRGNEGKRGEDINYVCEFVITSANKIEFGLFSMWHDCQIYDLVMLIKDMWERYLFELKRDMNR